MFELVALSVLFADFICFQQFRATSYRVDQMVTLKSKVLLFGISGQGLSTIANMLVSGELPPCPLLKTGDGMHGVTHTVASHEGRGYQVVTVEIGKETEIHWNDAIAIDLIFKSLKSTQVDVEYSHILFVMPASWFEQVDDDMWKLFLKIFEGAEPSFGLIVTECREPARWKQENEKFLQEKYGKFTLYLGFLPTMEDEGVIFRGFITEKVWLDRMDASLYHFFERNDFQYFKPNYDTATTKGCSTQPVDSSPEEMNPIDQAFPSEPLRKVLLFGKTGQGKSTIANMLISGELRLHDPIFKTGDGMSGATAVVASHEGRGYHVVDTFGIGEETETHRERATDLIYKFLIETRGEYSHILFVMSAGRFDKLDNDISQIFPKIFEGAEPAFGVVVTKCSDPKRWQLENEKLLQVPFGKFILPGRYIYVDFPPQAENLERESLLRNRRMRSLESLDAALQEFFRGNDFQYFKPTYANATDTYLVSFAKELLRGLFKFVKFMIFRCREL